MESKNSLRDSGGDVKPSLMDNLPVLTYLGIILIMMVSGVTKLPKVTINYIFSYYYYNNLNNGGGKLNTDILVSNNFEIFVQLSEIIGLVLGALLFAEKQPSSTMYLSISSFFCVAAVVSPIFIHSFKEAHIAFDCLFNIGVGMNMIFCLQCLWEYHPKTRGLMSGVIFMSYKLGSVLE